jgi:hypothetical protein
MEMIPNYSKRNKQLVEIPHQYQTIVRCGYKKSIVLRKQNIRHTLKMSSQRAHNFTRICLKFHIFFLNLKSGRISGRENILARTCQMKHFSSMPTAMKLPHFVTAKEFTQPEHVIFAVC